MIARFTDAGSVIRGATSVALRTQVNRAASALNGVGDRLGGPGLAVPRAVPPH